MEEENDDAGKNLKRECGSSGSGVLAKKSFFCIRHLTIFIKCERLQILLVRM
jgi:hypothetical protein